MGSSTKPSQQTQSTSSAPWAPAQPALKLGINDATKLYKKGVGDDVFGSTVIPFNKNTTAGMNNMLTGANNAQGDMTANFNQVAKNAQNGGLNALQNQAVKGFQNQANGNMLFNNPNVQKMIDMNARDIGSSTNLMASAAGRYGSGAHQGVTQRTVGDMATQVRGDDYNRERGYMQDALGSLFNAGQQQQTNINGNAAALQGAYGAMMQPAQTRMDVGGQYEDLATRQMNDRLRQFQEKQNAPWDQIARLNAVAAGAGSMGGTGQTTAQGPSRMQSTLGGAIGGFGATGSPWGAALGGLGGLFG